MLQSYIEQVGQEGHGGLQKAVPAGLRLLAIRGRTGQSTRLFERIHFRFSKYFKESAMQQSLLCSILPLILKLSWWSWHHCYERPSLDPKPVLWFFKASEVVILRCCLLIYSVDIYSPLITFKNIWKVRLCQSLYLFEPPFLTCKTVRWYICLTGLWWGLEKQVYK